MTLNNPGSAPLFNIASTLAFNTVAPIAWTDLDLSAVVGARKALVLLKFYNYSGDASANQYKTRPNGDAGTYNYGVSCTATTIGDGENCFLLCYTDVAGIIEWKAGLAKNTSISVDAWLAE